MVLLPRMSDHLHKFLFLGVMIALAVLGSKNPVAVRQANLRADSVSAQSSGGTPVFILQATPQITKDNASGSSETAQIRGAKNESDQDSATRATGDTISNYQISSLNLSADQNYIQNSPLAAPNGSALESDSNSLTSLFYRYGSGPAPAIQAQIALVADIKNGGIYFDLNPNIRWPLASITKLLSAVVLSQNIPLNQSATISIEDVPTDKSGTDLVVGNSYSIGDLRLAMLLESNNEAAMAIANFYGYDKFVGAMNAKAKEWGLDNTNFDGPIGISASNQSTATDLLSLARRVYDQYPEVFKITRTKSAYITELKSGKKILLNNINLFAGRPDFLGGKTGYTEEASGNLLSLFSYKKQPILIIVLGTGDRFGDTEKLLNWFENNYK